MEKALKPFFNIKKERIKFLNQNSINNKEYVTYWMQASQRVSYNHALEYAITKANDLNKKLIVYFGLTDNFPDANLRHYQFMIDGLKEVKITLEKMGIKFIVINTSPEAGAIKLASISSLMVTDRGYLRVERLWRDTVSKSIDIPLIQVESNVIVPIEEVSNKEEYAARTIRNKIKEWIPSYVTDFNISSVINRSVNDTFSFTEFLLDDIDSLKINKEVLPSSYYKGGIKEARKELDLFINSKIDHYENLRNHPELDYQSNMSPYLHFGQISPLEIYLKTVNLNSEAYLEELIIRRELAVNFVYYNSNYDNYSSIPSWANITLDKHIVDKRLYLYKLEELEQYNTHDIYWNACQKELVITGKMHGYMRMYWGKKVIEWTKSPSEAYQILVYLNNKYSIDGRDPSGYAGIAWCFGKHDRPWQERSIFGLVRYMNESGLVRKFDIDKYIAKINDMK